MQDYSHTEIVRLLLAYTNTLCTTDGTTVLTLASQNGHTEIVSLLLNKQRTT